MITSLATNVDRAAVRRGRRLAHRLEHWRLSSTRELKRLEVPEAEIQAFLNFAWGMHRRVLTIEPHRSPR